ncbi:hypothetical protein CVIRNUC_009411 [Coccomyxa viridis]|uniref:RRM domain-containing protein n=1 Tax=Coccomyxa viridis TaxID=1274662 RepID=A0AAV1IFU8_9CHLO|nr:hypothetical protein CVIRNUC_009411 [Coccomyxa viridis]
MGDEPVLGDDEDLVFELSDAGKASQDHHEGDFDLYGDIKAEEVENDVYAALYGEEDGTNVNNQQQHDDTDAAHGVEAEQSQSSAGQHPEPERPAAKPAQQEPPSSSGAGEQQQQYGSSSSVYIGSLQWWTSDAEIEALCVPHGAVQKIRFFEEKPSGKSKGYCLVTFDSPKGAYLCRQSLDGKEINGKKCVVTLTKTKEEYAGGQAAGEANNGLLGRGHPAGFRGRGQGFAARGQRGGVMASRPAYGQGRMGGMGMGQANGRMGWQGGDQGGPMPGQFMPGMNGPGMGMGMGGPGMGMGMGMPMGGPPMPFMPPGMGMQGMPYRPNGMMDGPYGGRGYKRSRY